MYWVVNSGPESGVGLAKDTTKRRKETPHSAPHKKTVHKRREQYVTLPGRYRIKYQVFF